MKSPDRARPAALGPLKAQRLKTAKSIPVVRGRAVVSEIGGLRAEVAGFQAEPWSQGARQLMVDLDANRPVWPLFLTSSGASS